LTHHRLVSAFCLLLAAFVCSAGAPPVTPLPGPSNLLSNAAPLTSGLRPAASALLTNPDPPASASRTLSPEPGTRNPVLNTNAFSTIATLDDKHQLALGDHLSFRIAEDLEDPKESPEPKALVVTDSGDLEVPYLGRFPALAKTCKQLSQEIKHELEKRYYYQATVMIALDSATKSAGKVYLAGQIRASGVVEIPGDEVFTLSKAILCAGGFTEYADKHHVRLTRKVGGSETNTQTYIVNLTDILEKGKANKDIKLESGDFIFVPSRLISF
jgi:protein involved in polysaccharide export with SLBB domain